MSWKPLQLSAVAGAHLPPLLISTTFTDDAYEIHLTDLVHIWSETLGRRAIVHRSREESTSIDPSSGDQFQIFIEKIKSGLAGAEGAIAALTVLNSENARPGFIFTLTVQLPGGLAPLVWPIQLNPAPQALLTSRLIIPLMEAQNARMREFESLAEVVREKDHVIQKVVDKLEASGTEFSEIFPQAAGKAGRKVDRKKAEDRVRGLAVFDINRWRSGLDEAVSQDMVQLIGKVFTIDTAVATSGEATTQDLRGDWWESIQGITIDLTNGKFSTKGPSKVNPSVPAATLKSEGNSEPDVYQVQATPPTKPQESSSVDGEDLDAPSQSSNIPDSFPLTQHPLPSYPPAIPKQSTTTRGNNALHEPSKPFAAEVESTVGEAIPREGPGLTVRTTSPPPKPVATRSKKALGLLGGPRQKVISSADSEPQSTLSVASESVKPKKGKLGQMGGKKKNETAADSSRLSEDNSAAASHIKEEPGTNALEGGDANQLKGSIKEEEKTAVAPPAEETETEKANRKRDALRRDLEEKAKAPVKKKRKF